MTDLISRLREQSRRGYWPLLGDEAADEIERLRQQHAQAMADMDAEIERLTTLNRALTDKANAYVIENARLAEKNEQLRTELANVNNEFGSQTADWPDAWKRVAELKQLSNGRWRETERLWAALKKANEQAERFERGWYLRGDALEVAVRQNEHDMLMTGEELRACRAALKEPT